MIELANNIALYAGARPAIHTVMAESKLPEFFRVFASEPSLRLWMRLLEEEVDEFVEASNEDSLSVADCLKEAADVAYVAAGVSLVCPPRYAEITNPAECQLYRYVVTDALRIIDFCSTVFGYDTYLEACFRVHRSNMSKLDDNGRVLRREDGKVLKGPNYIPPDFTDLLEGTA